jgi:hypothetical protein
MESRYLKLKEIRKALLMAGNEAEAQKVMKAMEDLIQNGLVSAEEIEAAAYL